MNDLKSSKIPIYDLDAHRRRFVKDFASSIVAVETLDATLLDCLSGVVRAKSEDRIVYLLAAACMREFNEIKLLATHEFGTGARKLLRAMYERVVALSYLSRHPEEIQPFIDYSDVHWHKLLVEAREAFGDDEQAMSRIVTESEARTIKEKFEKARPNFQQSDCKKCKTTRLLTSWTKKGTPELAANVSKEIRGLYFDAFLSPTLHIHTTFWGITEQYCASPEGRLVFNEAHEQDSAREAMRIAHRLLLQVLEVVNGHFRFGKEDLLRKRTEDWMNAWKEIAPNEG